MEEKIMEINDEKRKKFMENAGKRVNNVMHNIQILEPMARSNSYDFTKDDVEKMFYAIQETLDSTKAEFYKKFEEKSRTEKKLFSFDDFQIPNNENVSNAVENSNANIEQSIENVNNATETNDTENVEESL